VSSAIPLEHQESRVTRPADDAEMRKPMGAVIGPIVAAVVGAVLAGGAAFGIISSQTAVPSTVDAPYVVYGSTN